MHATLPTQAVITINVSDISVANDVRRLLKRVNGITDIKVSKSKNEIELSLEEAHKGDVTQWNSVDEYFKTILPK